MKPFWTTWKKIVFTIALAVLFWALLGCSQPYHETVIEIATPATSNGDTDAAFLQHAYASYNDQLFGNHLTKTPKIDVDLHNSDMANTTCDDDGTNCTLSFNLKYVAAPRAAQAVLLHEMCHIKVWSKHLSNEHDAGSEFYHDRSWRTCMLGLDAQGAFRQINIDYYHEEIR